ncbi:hypothetical protein DYB37_010039 [Aphanomyces astaci]|uniref:Uncharacterized protein n=2 Tax=Aphanomyces astaci TaxID=112090 RepID=A0A397EWU0_APHAT|nr:hypothetical protein DYB25_008313 [Aphanomyces astaci]RHZ02637.1 hypothetical protein DYB31_010345 [Aphanomyces astaci]RHZ13063.1 hypothetical protein DYB37_010039 [Aphanomyces astaci]RLO12530.1 hypothetical protein DYB28_012550 [Aphanomyces astaci]
MLATTPAMCGAAMDVPAILRYQLKLSASADLCRSRGGDSPLEKTGVIPAARHDVTMSSYAELYPRMNRPNATRTSDDPELPYSPKHEIHWASGATPIPLPPTMVLIVWLPCWAESTGVTMTMPLYGLNQPLLERQLCLSASWRYFSPVSMEPTTTPLPLKCLQMAGAPIVLTLQWGTVAFMGM